MSNVVCHTENYGIRGRSDWISRVESNVMCGAEKLRNSSTTRLDFTCIRLKTSSLALPEFRMRIFAIFNECSNNIQPLGRSFQLQVCGAKEFSSKAISM